MKRIILILISFPAVMMSQTSDTTYIYGDSLKEKNIQIFKNWDYHPDDDSSWVDPAFSSVGWKIVDCRLDLDSIKEYNWNGIGWFRKTIAIDSSLMNKTVVMTLNHYGASQFYINGKLIKNLGNVSGNSEKEEIYYSNSEPIIINFDTAAIYLFTVRYSNHLPITHSYLYKRYRSTIGFYATLKNLKEGINFYGVTQANDTALNAGLFGIFLSISVIYFLLFLFYSKQKEYLYYTIFTFSLSLALFNSVLDNTITSDISYFLIFTLIAHVIMPLIFFSVLAFLYQIFYGRIGKLFRYLILLGTATYILQFFIEYTNAIRMINFGLILITSIEILRVIYRAIRHRQKNAWVIGFGVGVFVLGIVFSVIFVLLGGEFSDNNIIIILLFSIPLSMSIYLARSSSQTNKNLETQLDNVKQLSEEAIEKEKTAAKLEIETQLVKAENERKTQELEHAKEIEKAFTELKTTQAQLIHAEKMASLGELTAGIAHEIKNPLNFVNNFSEVSNELIEEMKDMLKKEKNEAALEIAEDLKQNLEKINNHGKRADSIVKGMLLHSRGTAGENVLTDINELLDQYVELAYHGLRAQDKDFNIRIVKDYDTSIDKIKIIPQDISRVFLNLINNACYAANEKKRKNGDDFSPLLKVSTNKMKDKVEIRISDNGDGIPSNILDKIFQPFFTTKPTGEGTGLGLSLSYDIVTKVHNGEIKVETKEGVGTEFRIFLPV